MPTYPAGWDYADAQTAFKYPPQLPGVVTVPPAVATPAVPASGTALVNATGVDVMAYISGGTITVIAVNGGTVLAGTALSASLYLAAGAAVTLTYTGSPAWKWLAV